VTFVVIARSRFAFESLESRIVFDVDSPFLPPANSWVFPVIGSDGDDTIQIFQDIEGFNPELQRWTFTVVLNGRTINQNRSSVLGISVGFGSDSRGFPIRFTRDFLNRDRPVASTQNVVGVVV